MAPPPDRWFLEVVIDTGQRYLSADIAGKDAARTAAEDMRHRVRVVAVAMIHVVTGECVQRPSCNLLAMVPACAVNYLVEREALELALGSPPPH